MNIETVRMSSKGQIVIPQHIRESMAADEGTLFAVMGNQDTVVLKKIIMPSKEKLMKELLSVAEEGKKRLQREGITEKDIPHIVERARKYERRV